MGKFSRRLLAFYKKKMENISVPISLKSGGIRTYTYENMSPHCGLFWMTGENIVPRERLDQKAENKIK